MMERSVRLVERVPVISDTSKGPVVNLVAWITMTTMCLAVVTVLISKLVVLRKLRWNDLLISSAMLFSIAYTIAINFQVRYGLGSLLETLSDEQYIGFQKAGYASNFLYIAGLFFGKASTLSLLMALAPTKRYRIPMVIVGAITLLWAVTTILASAFQCSLPQPYLYTTGKCFSQVGFWDAVAAVDIATDVAIMALPVFLLHNLQLHRQKKIAVFIAFSFRIFAVGCAVFRIVELPKFFRRGTDVTFNSWIATIATTLELFFGIFAACVPHLRPFMESIQAGYLSGVIEEGEGRFGYGNDSYLLGKLARSKMGDSMVRSQMAKTPTAHDVSFDMENVGHGGSRGHDRRSIGHAIATHHIANQAGRTEPEKDHRQRSESLTSDDHNSNGSVGSKAMIIKTTKEWSVRYQDA